MNKCSPYKYLKVGIHTLAIYLYKSTEKIKKFSEFICKYDDFTNKCRKRG